MVKSFIGVFCVELIFLFMSCTAHHEKNEAEEVLDFGNLNPIKATELASDYSFVALESSEKALLGNIGQLEIYGDRIYILDNKTNAFFVFSKDGKFMRKLESRGNGPGEFISLHSFWIDKRGYAFILDRQSNRLLKYRLSDLEFVENVPLPAPSPLSFAVIPNQEAYIYYYPLRQKDAFSGKQIVVADGTGSVIGSFYDAPPAGKILHGSPANFYLFNGHIRIYPYFSNQVHELSGDSLNCCYELSWGKLQFPPSGLFQKYADSGEVMKEILTGGNSWIRLLYVYETEHTLAVKYYIKKEPYLSVWNKKQNRFVNVKGDMIADDWGIGGKFPLPVTVCDDKFVGVIHPFDKSDESNPVLVFYGLNSF